MQAKIRKRGDQVLGFRVSGFQGFVFQEKKGWKFEFRDSRTSFEF